MEEKDEARLKADVDEIMKRIETILENIKTLDPKLAKKAEKESD
jgi:hypothetical protein